MLAAKFPHPRDAAIVFRSSTHEYVYRDSFVFPWSVSSVAKRFSAPFDAAKTARQNFQKWQGDASSKYYKFISLAREAGASDSRIEAAITLAWKLNGETQRALGTALHARIEAALNGGDIPDTQTEVDALDEDLGVFNLTTRCAKKVRDYLESGKYEDTSAVINVSADIAAWREWMKEAKLTPVRTEWIVYSLEYKIAGQIDALFMSEGKFILVDWKRVALSHEAWRKCHPPFGEVDDNKFGHYTIQLNIYAFILEKSYGISVSEMRIVQIHPSLPAGYAEYLVPKLPVETIKAALNAR